MDNLFEILVPIIFAAIYFFGNMLSGKSGDDSAPAGPPRRDEDPDVVERQRRIQEEIRRKIMERRGQAGEGRPEPQASAGASRTARSEPSYQSRPAPDHLPHSENTYATSMQERLQQIEATKRQAEKLQKQAAARTRQVADRIGETAYASTARPSARRHHLGGSVRSSLRDPAAARAAFIYGEVLGVPVSQKKVSTVPGLS